MTQSKTAIEIINDALDINPKSAYKHRQSPFAIFECTSDLYTHYRDDSGEVVHLEPIGDKYAAVYVRVSTEGQKIDGWSVADQLKRGVYYCLEKKIAFRIFSDASLSGKLPIDDKEMIDEMRNDNSKRYEKAYRNVFFSDNRYESEKARMLVWLATHVKAIQNGTVSLDVDEDLEATKAKLFSYRPALTELMLLVQHGKIHTLLLTDISRLSRSQSLMYALSSKLQRGKVNIVGLIESLDYFNDDDFAGEVVAKLLTIIAEHKLKEITTNTIRGMVQRLESGEFHGMLPHWIQKTDKGIKVNESRAETIRVLVNYVIENPTLGYMRVAEYMNEHAPKCPTILEGTKKVLRQKWIPNTIRTIINNPALVGYQESFGNRWKVLPPIIEQWQWEELKKLQDTRKAETYVANDRKPNHLLTGVLTCQCGKSMTYAHAAREYNKARYRCTELTRNAGISKQHLSYTAPEIEEFISEIIKERPQILTNPIEDSMETKTITDEIAELKEKKIMLLNQLTLSREALEQSKRAEFQAAEIEPTEEDINSAVNGDIRTIKINRDIANIQNGIVERQKILSTTVTSDHIKDLKELIKNWESLNVVQKNDLIKKLIHSIVISKNESGVTLQIILNTSNRLALLPVHSIKKGVRGKPWDGLPTVDDWIGNWFTSESKS